LVEYCVSKTNAESLYLHGLYHALFDIVTPSI
jgi:hypothetical protein